METSATNGADRPPRKWAAAAWDMPAITPPGALGARATEIAVQPFDPSEIEGIGSALAIRPDPLQVFWTRPYGRSWVHTRWARADLTSGELQTSAPGAGLPGDLVDWLPGDDSRAWFLLTHGFALVDLERMRPVAQLTRGFPKWMSSLLPLGPGLVGVTGWTGETLTVVDIHTMTIRKSLRMHSPDAVWTIGDDRRIELLSFNGQTARSLDLGDLTLGKARPLPKGKRPLVRDDVAWIVRGTDIRDPRAPRIRGVRGERIAKVSLPTGEIIRESPTLDEPERVVAVDRGGRVVIRCRQGFLLLDPLTLEPVLRVRRPWGTFGAVALLPNGSSAAVLPNLVGPERLVLFEWQG